MQKVKCLKGSALRQGKPEVEGRLHSREVGATWWEQFSILLRRGFKERRHEYFSGVRVTQVISTAVIVGLLWWHSNSSSDPQEYRDQVGLLFFISVFWGFFPLFAAIFTFLQERAMLAKEQWADMYKLSAYFAARNISDLPLDLLLLTMFMLIVYFMVGLKLSFAAFSLTLLTVSLSIVAAQGLGLSIGAAFMDVKKASTLASITIMTFMLSGGYFIQHAYHFGMFDRGGVADMAKDPANRLYFLSDPNKNVAFLSFGSGIRACVGQKFAVLGVAATLASLLERYEVGVEALLVRTSCTEKLGFLSIILPPGVVQLPLAESTLCVVEIDVLCDETSKACIPKRNGGKRDREGGLRRAGGGPHLTRLEHESISEASWHHREEKRERMTKMMLHLRERETATCVVESVPGHARDGDYRRTERIVGIREQ
ncbi:hypothetical protein Ancab_006141 [Ancistrocladus abbreviatus]